MTYWSEGAWPLWVTTNGTYLLAAFLLVAGLIQSMRSAQRVFRALGEIAPIAAHRAKLEPLIGAPARIGLSEHASDLNQLLGAVQRYLDGWVG